MKKLLVSVMLCLVLTMVGEGKLAETSNDLRLADARTTIPTPSFYQRHKKKLIAGTTLAIAALTAYLYKDKLQERINNLGSGIQSGMSGISSWYRNYRKTPEQRLNEDFYITLNADKKAKSDFFDALTPEQKKKYAFMSEKDDIDAEQRDINKREAHLAQREANLVDEQEKLWYGEETPLYSYKDESRILEKRKKELAYRRKLAQPFLDDLEQMEVNRNKALNKPMNDEIDQYMNKKSAEWETGNTSPRNASINKDAASKKSSSRKRRKNTSLPSRTQFMPKRTQNGTEKKLYSDFKEYQNAIDQKEFDERRKPWYRRWFGRE